MTAPEHRLLRLLSSMEANRASDLFLAEGRPPAVRVDGTLRRLDAAPTSREELDALLAHLLPPARLQQLAESGDLDAGVSLPGDRRFRLNLSHERGRVHIVARAVPSGALRFEDLGLPATLGRYADAARGLVLVTGATGSGKSTTLAAMVHHINARRAAHIVTIEDPIEFVHEDLRAHISQREVGGDTRSFRDALRHVVRQSPDVILVGELRDMETMQVALSAALTGHLVLTSVHTIDATQTLQRMLSYFPDHLRAQAAMDLSLSLVGVVSQRLIPRADGGGRVVATELLTNTPPVAQLLREQRVEDLQDLMRGSRSSELQTFNASLIRLLEAGTITYEMGLAHASGEEAFALAAKGMATGVQTFKAGEGADTGRDMRGLLRLTLQRGASDLHLTVGRPPILRVAGKLEPLGRQGLTSADMRSLIFSILTARQRSSYEIDREIDFALALEDGQRFRVNAYFQKGRMAAALRAIPSEIPNAVDLRLPQRLLELGQQAQGLILVVGPTGAGKSTTLACLVDRVNRSRACRIITIEDPVEYAHSSIMATVDQREVFADTLSFAAALKFILRQDPDVIMVGEMRDRETIAAVLTAAETGHLVFATLHANDSVQAIDRVVDVFPPHQQQQIRSQLAATLLGVVSQRLLPRKHAIGRVAAFEMMVASTGIRAVIRDNKLHQAYSLMETGRRDGSLTMDQALRQLFEQGLIEKDDAIPYLRNPRFLDAPTPRG